LAGTFDIDQAWDQRQRRRASTLARLVVPQSRP
jgi:hypothetical protein